MANRLIYFKIIKQIHLVSSVILLTFIFIFLVTGIILVNRNLFDATETEVTNSKVLVEKPMNGNPDEYADYLKEKFGYKGRQLHRKENNGNYIFQYNFQGTNNEITLTPSQDTLYIRSGKQQMNLISFSTKLHHMRGFSGGLEYTLWAVFYDLTAISLIVFAITGILLWIKIRMRYTSGLWYLLAGIIIPLIIIILFLVRK